MLSICKVALGGEDYYLATAASGRDHAEGLVEPAGVWLGRGAEQLALNGTAEAGAVRRLLRGRDPVTGEELLSHPGRRRIAAFDCTFSVPKSVSILHAFSPDEFARQQTCLAHEAAVAAALNYLDEVAGADRRRGVDGPRVTPGALIAVGFLHRLSRAGDPHLHTHVLVANLVLGAGPGLAAVDERARSLDATHLFHACRTAGALYETHLRHELTMRLGVEWQPLGGRCWSDLRGIDRAMVRAMSQRTVQIGEGLKAEGWRGRAASQAMAELTRPPKNRTLTYEASIEMAWERLWRAGVSEARVRSLCFRRQLSPAVGEDWRDETLLRLERCTVDGTFSFPDVVRARCATARDGRSAQGVLEDARALLLDSRVLGRQARSSRLRGGSTGSIPLGRAEDLYSTSSIVAAEEQVGGLIRAMAGGRQDSVVVLGYEAGGRGEALDRLSIAVGRWREEGRSILGVAPGRWAAAGIEAACGAETVVVPGVERGDRRSPSRAMEVGSVGRVVINRDSVVLLAEAHCYGPVALGEILSACARAEATVVLLAPRRSLEQRWVFADALDVGHGRLPEQGAPAAGLPAMVESTAREESTATVSHVFGSVDVTLVDSLTAAREEAVRRLAEAGVSCDRGTRATAAFVVAGDEAVVAAVRAMPGVRSDEVVHARDVKDTLAAFEASPGERPHLILIGGASVLRQGATAAPGERRSHVLVAPGVDPRSAEARGRAAEAARPHYLVAQLGQPHRTPDERPVWRDAAVAFGEHRRRWGITDTSRAFGPASSTGERAHSGERTADRLVEQHTLERQAASVRSIGRDRRRGLPALAIGP